MSLLESFFLLDEEGVLKVEGTVDFSKMVAAMFMNSEVVFEDHSRDAI